jgi:Ser/Thr protein kinase RdoA (MazF antagonist)
LEDATKYFYDLSPDSILNAIEDIGVRCSGRSIALNSLENRVYEAELEIDDEQSIKSRFERFRIAKFYRPGRWSKEQILEEHRFLKELQAEYIRVVPPIHFPDNSTLRQLPNSDIWYCVFPKVGGRLLDELNDEKLETLGHLLARLHSIGAERPLEHRIVLNEHTYGYNNLDFLLDAGAIPEAMEDRYVDVVEQICELYTTWSKDVTLQRIHGDFHVGNIIWDDEGCVVVDFDDMLTGPCVQDIWLCTPGRDEEAKIQRDKLLNAYTKIREFDYESLRLVEPLRALRMVHFSAWILKRWEDPAFPHVFEDFGSQQYWREQLIALEEVLRYMHTGEC